MLALSFKALTGTDVVVVPDKGASNAISDMIGGQIDAGFETTSVVFGRLEASMASRHSASSATSVCRNCPATPMTWPKAAWPI